MSSRQSESTQSLSRLHLGILGMICLHAAGKETDLPHEIQLSDLTCSLANQVLCGFTIARLTFWSQVFNFIVKLVWFLTIVQFLALTLYNIQTAKFPVVHKILWQIFTLFEDQGSHAIAKYSFQNRWKVTQERQSKDEANNGQGGWSFKNQLLF